MPKLYYLPDDCCVETPESETILATSLDASIPHLSVCGGNARCSTCRVHVLEGLEWCSDRTYAETVLARQLGFNDHIRLACQTQVYGDGQITLRRLALDPEDIHLIEGHLQGQHVSIGRERAIAILFADLRGFTTFAEALPPYDVIYVLNRYFQIMGRTIAAYGGMINNYMGDGFMALFGWEDPDRAVERAGRAGVQMQAEMARFNLYLQSMYQQQLRIGIGIHFGEAVIGQVGASAQNQQVTAIGDAVNLASRIEAATKRVGVSLLMSAAAYHQVAEQTIAVAHPGLQLPGKTGEYLLYEITDFQNPWVAQTKDDSTTDRPLEQRRSLRGVWGRIGRWALRWLKTLFPQTHGDPW